MLDSAADSSRYLFRTLWFVGALLVFRLLYAAFFAVNPAGDEAYYWDWGRRPDIGYYSKPPMIAWIYAVVDWIGDGKLFAIRATATVLGTLSLLLVYRLAAEMFDARTGWTAVLLAGIAPANSVLSFFLTIDAPLIVLWTTALWMFWRIISERAGFGTWLLFFLALAAGHLTKQMMMAFPALAVVFLALRPETRPILRRPILWIVMLGSYLSLIPPLVWNARNGWITFTHTKHHFVPVSDGGNPFFERIEDFFSFLGSQLGVLGPGTAIALFPICLLALRHLRGLSLPLRLLVVFSGIPLAGMLLLALRQGLQPNWPAVFYVAGFVLVAAWYTARIHPRIPSASLRRLLPLNVGISAVLVAYFYFGPLLFQSIGKEGHRADPNRRILGHDQMAEGFEKIRRQQPDFEKLFVVGLGHRDVASHLAFALPDQPRVYRWETTGTIASQYEMWNDPFEDGLAGHDAIVLAPNWNKLPPPLAKSFATTEKLGEFDVAFGYDRVVRFVVFRGNDLKGWPGSPPPNPAADPNP